MRTKALICAAAMLVAGLANSQAQVYSVNVAGYATLQLTNGLNLIANPLDLDGTGTNNTVYSTFGTNAPNNTIISAFWPPTQTYSNATWATAAKKWGGPTNAVNAQLTPGKGVFVKIPATGPIVTNITFVGSVLQGALTNTFPVAQQMLSSQVPQGGRLVNDLGYAPAQNDRVSQWNTPAQKFFNANTYITTGGGKWGLGEPVVSVGEAVFITTHAASKWQRNFTVQ